MADEEIKETPVAESAAASEEVKVKKGKKRADVQGIACINATFNNTIISITDSRGNVIAWGSPGVGNAFKGSRKSTPFAAQQAVEAAAKTAKEQGIKSVEVYVKCPGNCRESAIRSLAAT